MIQTKIETVSVFLAVQRQSYPTKTVNIARTVCNYTFSKKCLYHSQNCKANMSFDEQYNLQGGRCFWCQRLIPFVLMTKEHCYVRRNQQRATKGGAWVLACEKCNRARHGLTIGSLRFEKWLRRVMRGDIRPFLRFKNAK